MMPNLERAPMVAPEYENMRLIERQIPREAGETGR